KLPKWLFERAQRKRGEPQFAVVDDAPVWVAIAQLRPSAAGHEGRIEYSPYGVARDIGGALASQLCDFGLGKLELICAPASTDEQLGLLVGFELGAYRYRQVRQPKPGSEPPQTTLVGFDAQVQ